MGRRIEFIKDWEKPNGLIVPKGNITGGRGFWLDEMIEKGFAQEYNGHLSAGQNTQKDQAKNDLIAERISKSIAEKQEIEIVEEEE